MKHETLPETTEQELQRLREMEQRISQLPSQEFVSAMAVVLQILAAAARLGFAVKETDAVAAVDRAQTYVSRLRDERDDLKAEVAELKAELSRVAPFLAIHGLGGYTMGPFIPTDPTWTLPEWSVSRDIPANTGYCTTDMRGNFNVAKS
jgi:hypothetical protein